MLKFSIYVQLKQQVPQQTGLVTAARPPASTTLTARTAPPATSASPSPRASPAASAAHQRLSPLLTGLLTAARPPASTTLTARTAPPATSASPSPRASPAASAAHQNRMTQAFLFEKVLWNGTICSIWLLDKEINKRFLNFIIYQTTAYKSRSNKKPEYFVDG